MYRYIVLFRYVYVYVYVYAYAYVYVSAYVYADAYVYKYTWEVDENMERVAAQPPRLSALKLLVYQALSY